MQYLVRIRISKVNSLLQVPTQVHTWPRCLVPTYVHTFQKQQIVNNQYQKRHLYTHLLKLFAPTQALSSTPDRSMLRYVQCTNKNFECIRITFIVRAQTSILYTFYLTHVCTRMDAPIYTYTRTYLHTNAFSQGITMHMVPSDFHVHSSHSRTADSSERKSMPIDAAATTT